jgi:5-methyltetrahydrofolate--homocysteine methyltransferase
MVDLKDIRMTLAVGEGAKLEKLTKAAMDWGIPAQKILKEGLIPGMEEVGIQFKRGDMYIPEVLVAAKAMKSALALLEPILAKEQMRYLGKVAIGTVEGDLHDIGKNLVIIMMKGVGFEVIDLGIDQSPERFVSVVKENDVQILGLSALLTTTMPKLKKTIDALKAAGVREKVKVMVGGAPVTQKYADEIGADSFASDAGEAAEKAKTLVG